MVSREVRLFGTEQVDAPLRVLRAGSLSAAFDNGAVRYVRVGGIEILRGIAFLVRDENWGTLTPRIENLRIDEGPNGFEVSYRAICEDGSRRLVYDANITGAANGSLSFEAVADPQTDVLTNRTGFIVLHPIQDLAGQPVRVRYGDGREDVSVFPAAVDPRCPFTEIRALSHEFAPGAWVTCTMEGDTFEMEDQRNWSDASYKTYVRSLRRPWPYRLPKGEKFAQAVRLDLSGVLPKPTSGEANAPIQLTIGEPIGRVPRIGIGLSAEAALHASANTLPIRKMAPRVMVCQIDLRLGHGQAELERYAALAHVAGSSVVLEIITKGTLDPGAELIPVAAAVRKIGLELEAVSVFPAQDMKSVQPDAPWPKMPSFAESYAAARSAFPDVTLGGGMAAYFTELNRKRPPSEALDYVTFTTCPNVHAADDVSVMETLESIPHLIRSTRGFVGERKPIRIGPSQLGCRENPYGQATTPNPANSRICLSRIDPRQRGLFNAAWTLGYIAACASQGVEVVTLGDMTGPFGHIYRKTDFEQPWYDQQSGDLLYPAFQILAGLTPLSGTTLLSSVSSGAGRVAVIAAQREGRTIVWVANLTNEAQSVELSAPVSGGRMALLDESSFEQAASDAAFMDRAVLQMTEGQISLSAYGVARIEFEGTT